MIASQNQLHMYGLYDVLKLLTWYTIAPSQKESNLNGMVASKKKKKIISWLLLLMLSIKFRVRLSFVLSEHFISELPLYIQQPTIVIKRCQIHVHLIKLNTLLASLTGHFTLNVLRTLQCNVK